MKIFALSALLVSIVSAQSLAGLPTCAYPCVSTSIPASCNFQPACICSAKAFIEAVTCCVASVCSVADQNATIAYAKTICDPAGVTITQTAATCASTTAAANGTAASTSMMSTTGSASTGSAAISSSISSVLSSASSAASSAASAVSTSSAGVAGQAVVAQAGNIFAALVGAAALL